MKNFETLRLERKDRALVVTVNRPDKLNALSEKVLVELKDLFRDLHRDPVGLRGVILTGAGEKSFIAGADIAAMARMTPEEGRAFSALAQEVTVLIETLPRPVIACVNGYAFGGGCEMAMSCDFIYASKNAQFAQPEVNLGLIPGFGGCVRLQKYVGPGRAKELIYTGRRVGADEAARMGLVSAVFEDRDSLLAAAEKTIREIADKSASAVALSKRAVLESENLETHEGLVLEREAFVEAFRSTDKREGVNAFLEKRGPRFDRDLSAAI